MPKLLVVYASRHGGTRGIAERIGEVLRAEGVDATVEPINAAGREVGSADAYMIGSGVYTGSWLKEGTEFLARYRETLARRPTWLFSSGPLRGSTAGKPGSDPLTDALGPEDGPGSGGRKKVAELGRAIGIREHRIFYGAFDPKDPPKAFAERMVRLMPISTSLLPPGDFREWDAIEAWARQVAQELTATVPAAAG
jgi:menaquinone-dependent protoporphyrinogen oxidase